MTYEPLHTHSAPPPNCCNTQNARRLSLLCGLSVLLLLFFGAHRVAHTAESVVYIDVGGGLAINTLLTVNVGGKSFTVANAGGVALTAQELCELLATAISGNPDGENDAVFIAECVPGPQVCIVRLGDSFGDAIVLPDPPEPLDKGARPNTVKVEEQFQDATADGTIQIKIVLDGNVVVVDVPVDTDTDNNPPPSTAAEIRDAAAAAINGAGGMKANVKGGKVYVRSDPMGKTVTNLPAMFVPAIAGQTTPLPTGGPIAYAITPDSGPESGGNICTIYGNSLPANVQIFFGPNPATLLSFDPANNTYQVEAPAGLGAAIITVVPDGGSATFESTLLSSYTYTASPSCCTTPGDFNHDGSFNIADVTSGIARIFSAGAPPFCQDEADANGDNAFNIADVTFGIARIFSSGPAPICGTTGG
jgi:IPT/TIG domain